LGTYGAAWWEELQALAGECLFAKKPDPYPRLVTFAAINGKHFAGEWKNLIADGFFADRALAHAAIAKDRGWAVPDGDPDPTMPLELLQLPLLALPTRDWRCPPLPDAALADAIRSADARYEAAQPRKTTKSRTKAKPASRVKAKPRAKTSANKKGR
jgi:hypothetical protein